MCFPQVYIISKAQLKTANKNYTTIKNDYEMTFNRETEVTPCNEDAVNIPKMSYDFVKIDGLQNIPKDSMVGELIFTTP